MKDIIELVAPTKQLDDDNRTLNKALKDLLRSSIDKTNSTNEIVKKSVRLSSKSAAADARAKTTDVSPVKNI